jgi:hypothetical protein|tara:strand:+ start:287 stop:715 length:429 start_codon:yes stop_codon:yes gene_type:complete
MGYTHYWEQPEGVIDEERWSNLCNDIKKITDDVDWELLQIDVNMGPEHIVIEGPHEWVSLRRDVRVASYRKPKTTAFNFCKTARKPYDYIVVACLLALKYNIPETALSSDGYPSEWEDGLNHFEERMGFGIYLGDYLQEDSQ